MSDTWWVGEDQLDEDQKAVIELPPEKSHLVMGPPGSGKTNLLLLRANYLALAGKRNILVVVFTKALQSFIAAGCRQYAFPSSKIKTSRKWQQDLLYQYGRKGKLPADFEEQRQYFVRELRSLIKTRDLGTLYDAILLDESQDYLPEEIQIFHELGRVLFAVADSRQKIYTGRDPIETLRSMIPSQHRLRYHYRNGLNICKLADELAKDSRAYEAMTPTSNYNETARPSSVNCIRCSDVPEEAKKLLEALELQRKAYPNEMLGVICPRKNEVNIIWNIIRESPLAPEAIVHQDGEHADFGSGKHVCVSTIHASKGLEFRALHIAGCEFIKKFQLQRNLAFTAVTRAKTSLSIYHKDDLPGYLEQAVASLGPQPKLPKIKDLFGRNR